MEDIADAYVDELGDREGEAFATMRWSNLKPARKLTCSRGSSRGRAVSSQWRPAVAVYSNVWKKAASLSVKAKLAEMLEATGLWRLPGFRAPCIIARNNLLSIVLQSPHPSQPQ